jgi:hypothetical protein
VSTVSAVYLFGDEAGNFDLGQINFSDKPGAVRQAVL